MKIFKPKNITNIESLMEDVPMGCKDHLHPKPLLENHNPNSLTVERNAGQHQNDNLC